VRRIFEERARLVVYVESAAAGEMEKRARGEGKTLVEWMRETLLGELENGHGDAVRKPRAVRMGGRRSHARNGGTLGEIEDIAHEACRANGVNPVDTGTESGQGVPEDGVSTRTASPKSCDTASYAAAENPIQRLDGVAASDHAKGCMCGICKFKREAMKEA
jgi:hypothetical protein